MAYVGGHQSVAATPWGSLLGGIHTHIMWRSFYWGEQMSMTNKAVCLFDWLKSALGGRDVGRDHLINCSSVKKEKQLQSNEDDPKQ